MTGAKIVTSAKSPGSKCFGFVTMSTCEEAECAIRNLTNTEIAKGQKITVEKVTVRIRDFIIIFAKKTFSS